MSETGTTEGFERTDILYSSRAGWTVCRGKQRHRVVHRLLNCSSVGTSSPREARTKVMEVKTKRGDRLWS